MLIMEFPVLDTYPLYSSSYKTQTVKNDFLRFQHTLPGYRVTMLPVIILLYKAFREFHRPDLKTPTL